MYCNCSILCFIFSRCFQKRRHRQKIRPLFGLYGCVCVCDVYCLCLNVMHLSQWERKIDIIVSIVYRYFCVCCNCQTDDANLLPYANYTLTKETVPFFFIFSLLYLWFACCSFFSIGLCRSNSLFLNFTEPLNEKAAICWCAIYKMKGEKYQQLNFRKCVYSFFSYWNSTVSNSHNKMNEK